MRCHSNPVNILGLIRLIVAAGTSMNRYIAVAVIFDNNNRALLLMSSTLATKTIDMFNIYNSNILEIKYLVFFPCGHLQYPWRKFLCLEAFQPQISPKLSGRDPRYECFGDERSLGFSVCLSKFHWLKFP